MPQHPGSSHNPVPQVPSKSKRRAARGTAPKTGKLPQDGQGPTIGSQTGKAKVC